jgi:uncharacterized protein YegP (UPF0339 family)
MVEDQRCQGRGFNRSRSDATGRAGRGCRRKGDRALASRPQLMRTRPSADELIHLRRADQTVGAKFELYKSPKREYRWRLRASNGQIIATGGEGYSSEATAQGGIESVKRDAASAPCR